MKILVLFTRLTGYWMACMQFDHQKTGNEYMVIRQTPSPEAPFKLNTEKGIKIINGDGLDVDELQKITLDFNPDLIYCSGWKDKRFLKIALYYRKQHHPVILGMDNQWKGNLKQKLAGVLSPVLIRKYFTHIWIPGLPQLVFANKLSFAPREILTGLYCADNSIFEQIKQTKFKHQITFIGRLVEHKGLKVLCEVLDQLITENQLDFKVHIIGNGPLSELIPKHSQVTHTSFVDPADLPKLLENAGFLILPSLYEAWGVVLHEAVLAGLPVISTYQTGAVSEFVIHSHNGYLYDAFDKRKLEEILLSIGKISEKEYFEMSNNSKALAQRINLNSWSATLNSVLDEKKWKLSK